MSRRTDIIQALDPVELWRSALRCEPDAWQRRVLRSPHKRIILCCARQVGKSQTVAIKALHLAKFQPRSLVLLVSRSLRQSLELGKKVFDAYEALGNQAPPESQSKLALELRNHSRILYLPGGDDSGIRGFSATSVIIDEAARCSDALFGSAIQVMLAGAWLLRNTLNINIVCTRKLEQSITCLSLP
jgi:hypothetical protein